MDCSFSPKIQAWATQEGRTNATKSASVSTPVNDAEPPVSAAQRNTTNCTNTHHVGLDICDYVMPKADTSFNTSTKGVPDYANYIVHGAEVRDPNCSQHQDNSMDCSYRVYGAN